MRRSHVLIVVIAAALAFALAPGVAMANNAIHGGYSMDTDACAGCHRAHTAASSIRWTKTDGSEGSALLLSTADEVYEFCLTCHGADAAGAATNVWDGIYEGTEEGTQFDMLNGGGFSDADFPTTHLYTGVSWPAWGGSTDAGLLGELIDAPEVVMSCSTCHDVHGSSNYRLLKDVVNGRTVGGYIGAGPDPTPDPWVISNEPGYPDTGWLLHEPGAVQVAGYTPNYTEPMYSKAPDEDPTKGISGWCAACHVQYLEPTSTPVAGGAWWDVNQTVDALGESTTDGELLEWQEGRVYDVTDGFGYVVRHKHPINVELANYLGARDLNVNTPGLPLAHSSGDVATHDLTDWIDCLTCHRSHGSGSSMTGFARVADSTNPEEDTGPGGVAPAFGQQDTEGPDDPRRGNALLRLDNRGVCESCHNK